MVCGVCGYGNYGHDKRCPLETKDAATKRTRYAAYRLGYLAGRSGDQTVIGKGLGPEAESWNLGRTMGVCALEERENGFDPIRDGRQW